MPTRTATIESGADRFIGQLLVFFVNNKEEVFYGVNGGFWKGAL